MKPPNLGIPWLVLICTFAVFVLVDGLSMAAADVSINSTSQNGTPGDPVPDQPFAGNDGYKIFAINDLGMHCGDLDTRISSILPPFNVLHAQVIRRGDQPDFLTRVDGVEVVYSAASNPQDPILTGINSAGSAIPGATPESHPVLSSMLADGSVFKTNFWDIALAAYDPFYPADILPAFYPAGVDILDLGLPMPDVERLYLGDEVLTADQQAMPAVTDFDKDANNLPTFLASAPYVANEPQEFALFVTDQAFFINPAFQFGYVSEGVNWFEAAGIALTAFDDFGRENPWPLYRVQAHDASGTVLASTDTVVPISGEANCGFCHNALEDGGNGSATQRLFDEDVDIALAEEDTDNVPEEVSLEWAADLNLLRLHDLKHGSGLGADAKYTPDLVDQTPVVCQRCHYTPALDLAQLGPLGPENADPALHNGRDQIKVRSMSNVMHSHHGEVRSDYTNASSDKLFPPMPDAIKDENGVVTNDDDRRDVLEATCYQCHPGRRTDCLRGAMSNGGMLCQDCHGDMAQVGDDFTRTVGEPDGGFELGGDFYTNAGQPRVPWANEPGCGSCHTGDALDNLAGTANTVVNNVDTDMNTDGIRLFKAYRTDDSKATPIVPSNKRFAENIIEADNPAVSGPADPRIGNPMLYRVSSGHEGVFCEACHGSTHGIWPNKNPNANDNVTANQLQGHTGTIIECSTCHGDNAFKLGDFQQNFDSNGWMKGPHGMHPVNDLMWTKKHKEVFNDDPTPAGACQACHGQNLEGTVLARTATDRTLQCKDSNLAACFEEGGKLLIDIPQGTPVSCDLCHKQPET